MTAPELSFFCPAYRDAANLPPLVADAHAFLTARGRPFEIVIVEDGCPEGSAETADALAAEYPEVRVVHHERNRGYGAALRSGFSETLGDIVLYTDGDRQFAVEDLGPLLDRLDEDVDAVVGYRINRAEGTSRAIPSAVYRWLGRHLLGTRVRDPNCALKVIRRRVLDAVPIASESPFVILELMAGAERAGFEIVEMPVRHYPRQHGQASVARPAVAVQSFRDLLRYRFRD